MRSIRFAADVGDSTSIGHSATWTSVLYASRAAPAAAARRSARDARAFDSARARVARARDRRRLEFMHSLKYNLQLLEFATAKMTTGKQCPDHASCDLSGHVSGRTLERWLRARARPQACRRVSVRGPRVRPVQQVFFNRLSFRVGLPATLHSSPQSILTSCRQSKKSRCSQSTRVPGPQLQHHKEHVRLPTFTAM